MIEKKQFHVLISGVVQGVGYRIWTKNQANQLNVKGWVRNLPNGNVEAVFQGESSAISKMLRLCNQGPPLAKVNRVKSVGETLTDFTDFQILPTPRI